MVLRSKIFTPYPHAVRSILAWWRKHRPHPLLNYDENRRKRPLSNLKLLDGILRLKGMKITRFWFANQDRELHLSVKRYKNGCRCPECGRRSKMVTPYTRLRQWEDLTLMGLKVFLWYSPKEIRCLVHGRVQEEIPWAGAFARITYHLEWRISSLGSTRK